jgi:hypothetical protein
MQTYSGLFFHQTYFKKEKKSLEVKKSNSTPIITSFSIKPSTNRFVSTSFLNLQVIIMAINNAFSKSQWPLNWFMAQALTTKKRTYVAKRRVYIKEKFLCINNS